LEEGMELLLDFDDIAAVVHVVDRSSIFNASPSL
jgi:hypothetical protein